MPISKKSNNIDILIMSDNGLETVGGEQESTKIIINGVKDHYSLGVIQPGNVKKKVNNVKYYGLTKHTRIKHLIKNPFNFLKYIWNVRKIIHRENPKVIHTQAQVSFFIIALLCKLKLLPRRLKMIHTERGLYTKYSNLIKKVFFFFMKELDLLVTTTHFNMKHWKQALKKKRIKLKYRVIENTAGELFETYDPRMERKEDGKLVVGFAGRYTDWKNWPLAVEICEKLNEKLGSILEVRMAVGCLDKDAKNDTHKMFTYLSEILEERFIGYININLEKMDKFYYELDFFILTSDHNTESFGRTLVEAMSRKTVVLTTDAGGSVEVVGDLSKVLKAADEFVNKISDLHFYKNLLRQEKELNFKYVKEKYSLKNNVQKHNHLYNTKILPIEK